MSFCNSWRGSPADRPQAIPTDPADQEDLPLNACLKRRARRVALPRPISSTNREILLLLVVLLLAADGLQLGEHGVDVEVVFLLFARLEFRLLPGGLGGRKQRGAAVGRGH